MQRHRLPVALLVLSLAATAHAQAGAREAYQRGVDAHKHGDFERAAQEFARADAIAPSAVALQAALDDAVTADDPALGGELLERSQRAPASGELAKSIENAKKKFAGRAGRVKIGCPEGASCLATIDGAAANVGKPVWTRAGQHTIVVQVDGEAQTKLVDVKPDAQTDVTPAPKSAGTPPPPPPPPPPTATATAPPPPPPEEGVKDHPDTQKPRDTRDGLPPIIFWVGAGATVILAGAGITLGILTKNEHDDFVKAGCDKTNASGCSDKRDTGVALMATADTAFGLAALAGIATIVIGVGFTDWKGPKAGATPVLAPVAGGAIGGWAGRF